MLASTASTLVFVMMIAVAFIAPIGTAMLRVPAGGLVALTVMMVIVMLRIAVSMLGRGSCISINLIVVWNLGSFLSLLKR